MSAQVIPFPTRSLTLDPFAEQFYQYALGEYPHWDAIEPGLDESFSGLCLWITWDRWRQRSGLGEIKKPDLVAIAQRIVRHNTRHKH